MLTSEQQRALVQWTNLLAEGGLDRVLIHNPPSGPPQVAERFRVLARLFGKGQAVERHDLLACVPEELLSTLEALGLLNGIGDRVAPAYRLLSHLGLWLFCEKTSPSTKFYYGNCSLELSRMFDGAGGTVLDLCSGVGTQALVSARTAARVTAVEIEPLAAKLFWVNAAMNGLADKVELVIGDFFEPVAGQRFDVISCNPPWMPVAPEVRYPMYADGGADGLIFVRRLMAGLPEALVPDGRCEAFAGVLGNREGPNLAAFKTMAADSSLAIVIDCLTCEELEGKVMEQFVGLALEDGGGEDVEQAFRRHFASLGATHIYCSLVHAMRQPSPMVCASYRHGPNTAFWMVPFH
ncbi:MAG: methyltransferase [Terriglobia bacterium]|jgi:methylase of polypeptide subunit release factors